MLLQINWCDLESILLFETILFLFILASCIGTTTKILLCSLIICFEWSFDIVRNLMVQLNSIMLSNHWFTSAWCYVYLLQMKSVKNFIGRSHVANALCRRHRDKSSFSSFVKNNIFPIKHTVFNSFLTMKILSIDNWIQLNLLGFKFKT